ncbi:hypothetical protein OG401_11740 [Kitasatospora purpeofusca]|uniref:AAA family ATPase n=1 Tax=Kitasatospora purpeofusca TaxID=67352 RepID=UPI00224DA933|nr:AAA family ATPase [Kitasatospora purpeofusca]MCX4684971.1 hypothetical protein [Kitasatospora purpeofusca]
MTDDGVRVVLIGGTSNTGKSTLGRLLADRLGFAHRSTDTLARHPGRPWPVPGWEVPPHVAEHYRTLSVEELIASVREHYARLWPRIEQLVAEGGDAGLVLEGSALWPPEVARFGGAGVSAHWLRADEAVLRTRIRTAGRYPEASQDGRYLMDKFLARSVRYQELLLAELAALGPEPLDAGDGRCVEELADAVLATVTGAG